MRPGGGVSARGGGREGEAGQGGRAAPACDGLDDGVVEVPAEEGLGEGVEELHEGHGDGLEVGGSALQQPGGRKGKQEGVRKLGIPSSEAGAPHLDVLGDGGQPVASVG